jgi:hypothetical protein
MPAILVVINGTLKVAPYVQNPLMKENKYVSTSRDLYFESLGLSGDDEATKSKRKNALNRAYQLRTFEIEHYWKRATYFWGFQIAIFAAFGLVWRDLATNAVTPIAVALAGLGILTALANYLSARGSKFWQQNWESHIDMLEDGVEGRLHKTVWLSDGKTRCSVSRVNESLSLFFTLFWIGVALYVALKFVGWPNLLHRLRELSPWLQLSIIAVPIALGALTLVCQKTRFPATRPKENGSHGEPFEQRPCLWKRVRKSPTFIRRYAPDELPPSIPQT